jgi:hypothetical protein
MIQRSPATKRVSVDVYVPDPTTTYFRAGVRVSAKSIELQGDAFVQSDEAEPETVTYAIADSSAHCPALAQTPLEHSSCERHGRHAP